nr:MAG TPA: hypothetical protein [Caudoviricetes sp.]
MAKILFTYNIPHLSQSVNTFVENLQKYLFIKNLQFYYLTN